MDHIFFSALLEQEKIDKDIVEGEEAEFKWNSSALANRAIMLNLLKQKAAEIRKLHPKTNPKEEDDLVTIGFAGYPNVGKSSLINVLCQRKLVAVTSQPGKTKHFQTLYIEKNLMLCDCPGLVFPSIVSSRAEMVCNGVLPIDQMKDYWPPVQVMAMNIPVTVFEDLYHITVKYEGSKPSASDILQAYALRRGYFTGGALPDEAKSAKILLKDYVSGKLLFCKLPPTYDPTVSGPIWQYNPKEELTRVKKGHSEPEASKEEEVPEEKKKDVIIRSKDLEKAENLDEEFFEEEDKMDQKAVEVGDDDIDQAIETKQLKGIKLTKGQRRDIKFAQKRGEVT